MYVEKFQLDQSRRAEERKEGWENKIGRISNPVATRPVPAAFSPHATILSGELLLDSLRTFTPLVAPTPLIVLIPLIASQYSKLTNLLAYELEDRGTEVATRSDVDVFPEVMQELVVHLSDRTTRFVHIMR